MQNMQKKYAKKCKIMQNYAQIMQNKYSKNCAKFIDPICTMCKNKYAKIIKKICKKNAKNMQFMWGSIMSIIMEIVHRGLCCQIADAWCRCMSKFCILELQRVQVAYHDVTAWPPFLPGPRSEAATAFKFATTALYQGLREAQREKIEYCPIVMGLP